MTKVWITTQFVATHYWPKAPEIVSFLRHPHRHIFHVKGTVETEADREVEFFMLKDEVNGIIDDLLLYTDRDSICPRLDRSCEQTAKEIFSELKKQGYNVVEVEVNEDNENGAIYYEAD